MADSSSPTERPQDSRDDVLVLNKDLERMIDGAESISVQLTWMGYDMVALRTSPEVGASMRKLEEAYLKCRLAVDGNCDQEPETDKCPEPSATTLTQM
ncbi:synaptonemal complex central element protein 3 [Lates calcarifer]|uniref:Synaptonemal complex central element protein 3 n=1 Tax=Lates calcarifer TaxID=8187 RepID=A0A4W6CF39_LATCA|nr:synaptonemal complex central element protein 3 [Lates calcarifer]